MFNLYTDNFIRNARLDEFQAEIKIGRRNIKTSDMWDDATLMAESEEELKSLDEGEEGERKGWLKTQY